MSSANGTNAGPTETFAIETRAEELTLLSRTHAVRDGESDQLEVGRGGGSDTVLGKETLRVGGNLAEKGNNKMTQAERFETSIEGKMSLRAYSDTTMMAGAMTDVQTGAMLVLAGMSDDLCIGGGVRLTMMDLWACGLMGMEENPMSAIADAAFLEGYRTHFEREYGAGIHLVGSATFTGALHTTMATGFRALMSVAWGVRNMTPGGGAATADGGPAGAAPVAPATQPEPPRPPNNNAGVIAKADDVADVEDLHQLDDAMDAAKNIDPNVVDVEDSASVLEDLRQADEPIYDDIVIRPRVDDADNAKNADQDVELYAVVRMPGYEVNGRFEFEKTDWELNIITPDGSRVGFSDSSLPSWATEGLYQAPVELADPYVPPRPTGGYEPPVPVVLPDDFDYTKAFDDFTKTLQQDYRDHAMPGLQVMQVAQDQAGLLPWDALRHMDPEWLADAGISADDLVELKGKPTKAYQAIVDMEAAARVAGDIEKADSLRATLLSIDKKSFTIFENAVNAAEPLRQTGFLPIPGNLNVDSVIADLEAGMADLQRQSLEAVEAEDMQRVNEIAQKNSFYITAIDALKKGYDPTPYLDELLKTGSMFAGDDPYRLSAVNAAYDEVFNLLGDTKHLFDPDLPAGFKFDPGDVVATGPKVTDPVTNKPVYNYSDIRDYLLYMVANPNGYDMEEVRKALENIEDAAVAQLDGIPAEYIEKSGMWQDVANAKASGDPLEAYRVLTEMEAFFRSSDDAADIARADNLRSIIDTVDGFVVDEYAKVYDLVQEFASGSKTPSVPFIPDVPPLTDADDANIYDDIVNTNARNVYENLSPSNLGPDDAATYDDIQAGLGLNPNQVNVETVAGEQPLYINSTDGVYDVIRMPPEYDNINPISPYDNFPRAPEAEDGFYDLLRHREDGDIYGDFGPVGFTEGLRLDRIEVTSYPADKDGYKFMSPDDIAKAKGKYKKAGDWSLVATDHKRFFDFQEDPLALIDPNPVAPPVPPRGAPPEVDDIYYKWDLDTKKFVPVDNTNIPPPPPPPPDDPDAVFVWDGTKHVKVDSTQVPPPPPLDVDDDYFKWDPTTGKFVPVDDVDVPPPVPTGPTDVNTSLLDTDGKVFTNYFPDSNTTTLTGEELYEVTRSRFDVAEESAYNTLVFGFQRQAPDSLYSKLDELKMSTDFTDAPSATYVNYDSGRAILVDSLDTASDIVTPPVAQPNGLDRPGKVSVWIDDQGEMITVIDFVDETIPVLPPVSADLNEGLYASLSPVMISPVETGASSTTTHVDGTVSVIEEAWRSTDPIVTVLNREPHEIAAEAFYEISVGEQLPRLNRQMNSLTDLQQAGGSSFNLAALGNIEDLDLLNDIHWQLGMDPVLDPNLHEISEQGRDIVSTALNRGALGVSPVRPTW